MIFNDALINSIGVELFPPKGSTVNPKIQPLGHEWPFPTLDNPLKPWDNQQVKDYEAVKRSNVPDAPL